MFHPELFIGQPWPHRQQKVSALPMLSYMHSVVQSMNNEVFVLVHLHTIFPSTPVFVILKKVNSVHI